MTTSTTGGTELQTVLTTATDDTTNRSTTMPTGAVLRKIRVNLWSTTDPAPAGKHQCMLLYQPGATTYASPIASWFSTTNPITEENQQIRSNILGRHPGVHTRVVSSTPSGPVFMSCFWKGKQLMHDGDDIVLVQLDAVSTAWTGVCDYTYIM